MKLRAPIDEREDWHEFFDLPAPGWVTWLVVCLGAAWVVLGWVGLFTVLGWLFGGGA